MTTKVSRIARLSSRLQKHGVSFGDVLNLALFVLTISSLFLAYQGVRLARIALEEAHEQGKQQNVQFKEQLSQLQISSRELGKASNDLDSQSEILRDLQNTSRQQLKDLNAAEARIEQQEKARPMPRIAASCGSDDFLMVSERDFRHRGRRQYQNSATISPDWPGEAMCFVAVTNDGTAELKNVGLELYVSCVHAASPPVVITYINDIENVRTYGYLIAHEDVPPRSRSDRPLHAKFIVRFGRCATFKIRLKLEADNLDTSFMETLVKLRQP